ncbi:hypothetical protein Tco_1414273, partial [Tanacetum coccineum]
ESELCELKKQNELLKDRLLEASLAEDVKNLVLTSCVEIGNKDLQDENEQILISDNSLSNSIHLKLLKKLVNLGNALN